MTSEAKPYWTTAVSDVDSSDVYVRGYPLKEIVGRLPFPAACFLLIRARLPSPGEARMMDAILCSVLDYSLQKPGTVAARYCVSGNPSMVAGMATAVLSVGEYTLAPDDAGRFITETYAVYRASGEPMAAQAEKLVAALKSEGKRIPGLGHPNFRVIDPRAQRLKETAIAEGVWGDACDWYEAVHKAFISLAGKPDLVINEVGIMAAVLAQMGFTPPEMTGVAIISSLPGVVAHVSEELQSKQRIRVVPDSIAEYPRSRKDLEEDLASAGWGRK
ncbi:citrate synthase [Rhodoligotrophos appendicifer]|uniref:citryl-CoA lyase n=1 Tax=Rhodoligotrophos appendicifer TaxID=987056 RepID=UPI0011858FB2|nr:citryl-CoA lyase [Rhodoligotrophos appendicifer]